MTNEELNIAIKIAKVCGFVWKTELSVMHTSDEGLINIHKLYVKNESPRSKLDEWRYFNPIDDKESLMDVECALGIDILWIKTENIVIASSSEDSVIDCAELISDHPDKFTARAAAVCAVAEQIYDKGQV